jgi:hypothetical protein
VPSEVSNTTRLIRKKVNQNQYDNVRRVQAAIDYFDPMGAEVSRSTTELGDCDSILGLVVPDVEAKRRQFRENSSKYFHAVLPGGCDLDLFIDNPDGKYKSVRLVFEYFGPTRSKAPTGVGLQAELLVH